jgi:hypothetical protein
MARFFRKFTRDPVPVSREPVNRELVDPQIARIVDEIWFDYDVDRSGWLDKRETLVFLKDILNEQNRPQPTAVEFNKWFAEYDLNGNGTIEKHEMAAFVKHFFPRAVTVKYQLVDLIDELFERHDLNRNGILEKREALSMINELLRRKGESSASLPHFNRLY